MRCLRPINQSPSRNLIHVPFPTSLSLPPTQLKLVNHDNGNATCPTNVSSALATGNASKPNTAELPQIPPHHHHHHHHSEDTTNNGWAHSGQEKVHSSEALAGDNSIDNNTGVGEGAVGEEGGDGRFEEAMIDESEYTEEHHEEQRLFEGMQELLTVRSRCFLIV